jgi:hypothetical protein
MIEGYDIGWFEEPVPPEDVAGYREVKAALSIPIAGGECEFTRFGFRDLLVSRAVDIVQPDTCAAGGLSECKKIADMAEAFGVRYNPHVWGTGIAIAASLQLLAVLPSHTPPSLLPVEPMLEFDRTEHPIRQAILTRPIEHAAGMVRRPKAPGLVSRSTARHWPPLRSDEVSIIAAHDIEAVEFRRDIVTKRRCMRPERNDDAEDHRSQHRDADNLRAVTFRLRSHFCLQRHIMNGGRARNAAHRHARRSGHKAAG